jgi:hypothetical protein
MIKIQVIFVICQKVGVQGFFTKLVPIAKVRPILWDGTDYPGYTLDNLYHPQKTTLFIWMAYIIWWGKIRKMRKCAKCVNAQNA